MRPPWYPQTTSTKKKQMIGWKPLKVWSMFCSQKKPQTFIVTPASHPRSRARRAVCRCIATRSGTHATNVRGQTSIPANASQYSSPERSAPA